MHTSSHFTFPGKHFLLVFIASLLALSSLVAPVYAASMVNSVRNIQLSPNNGPPNTIVTVNGVGFGIQESVVITFDSQQIGSGMTNGQGAFAIKFTVPGSTQPGFHLVEAIGQNSGLTARATFLLQYQWQIVHSPGKGSLQGVAVVSASDIWAVGVNGNYNGARIEHWNGTAWSIVSSPKSGGGLNSLAVVFANDIWAVGSSGSGTLTEHWNGSTWSVVPSPSPDSSSTLNGVAMVSPNDIWAVGSSNSGPLTEHWDGTSWTVVANPNLGSGSFYSVAMVSTNDVWAVGSTATGTLIEQWDGSSWTVVSQSNSAYSSLTGIAVVSANDVWAVGNIYEHKTLTEHWNGKSWVVVPSPSPRIGHLGDVLSDVAVVSPNNVWAVGSESTGDAFYGPLIENWNGTKWVVVNSPTRGYYNGLSGVASVPGTEHLWTVGGFDHGIPETYIEYYG